HTVPQPIPSDDLGQLRGWQSGASGARGARPQQVGRQVPGGLGRQTGRVGGRHQRPPGAIQPQPAAYSLLASSSASIAACRCSMATWTASARTCSLLLAPALDGTPILDVKPVLDPIAER